MDYQTLFTNLISDLSDLATKFEFDGDDSDVEERAAFYTCARQIDKLVVKYEEQENKS